MAAHQAGVGGEVLQHRVADGGHLVVLGVGQVVVVEGVEVRGVAALAVIVEFAQQQHVRPGTLDDFGDVADLLHVEGLGLLGAAQGAVGEAGQQGILLGAGQGELFPQHAGCSAIEGEIEGGKANHGGPRRQCGRDSLPSLAGKWQHPAEFHGKGARVSPVTRKRSAQAQRERGEGMA